MNNQSFAILILRLIGGGFMLTHGIPKLVKVINGDFAFADPIGIGPMASLILTVFAEVICAVLIIVGYKTKLASVPLMITMLVAAFIVHFPDAFKKKEFALLYFGIYLALYFLGSGRYSLDNKLSK